MGLDMYLTREHYAKNFDFMSADERWAISISGPEEIDVSKVVSISEEIHCWYGARSIHQWFVENVQGGEDNCARYWVSVEQLQELAENCRRVLEDPSLAKELLPPADAFFFGPTPTEEYLEELRDTLAAIKDLPDGDYYYTSSW